MEKFINISVRDEERFINKIERLRKRGECDSFIISTSINSGNDFNSDYSYSVVKDVLDALPFDSENNKCANTMICLEYLYMIYPLLINEISSDMELEEAKITYFFNKLFKFVSGYSEANDKNTEFLIALLCFTSHLIDDNKNQGAIRKNIKGETLDLFINLLNVRTGNKGKVIRLVDFKSVAMLQFFLPFGVESVNRNDVFASLGDTFRSSVFRVLIRVIPLCKIENENLILQRMLAFDNKSTLFDKVLLKLFNGEKERLRMELLGIVFSDSHKKLKQFSLESDNFNFVLNYKRCSDLLTVLRFMVEKKGGSNDVYHEYFSNKKEFNEIQGFLLRIIFSNYNESIKSCCFGLLSRTLSKENIYKLLKLMITTFHNSFRSVIKEFFINNDIQIDLKDIPSELLHGYGSRSSCIFDILYNIFKKKQPSDVSESLSFLMNSFKSVHEKLKKVPNFFIYDAISKYIRLDGAYLESPPCLLCTVSPNSPQSIDITANKSNIKFTSTTLTTSLKFPLSLESIDFTIVLKQRIRKPRLIKIYTLRETSDDQKEEIYITEFEYPLEECTYSLKLDVSVYTEKICIEIASYWEINNDSRLTRCIKCHGGIPDPRSGICPQCYENTYQCLNCRHINYGNLDGFFCSQCGNSYYAVYYVKLRGRHIFCNSNIDYYNDVDQSISRCSSLYNSFSGNSQMINQYKNDIISILSEDTYNSEFYTKLDTLYNVNIKAIFDESIKHETEFSSIRSSINSFFDENGDRMEPESTCYICLISYLSNIIGFIADVVTLGKFNDVIKKLEIDNFILNLSRNHSFKKIAANTLYKMSSTDREICRKIFEEFERSAPNVDRLFVDLVTDFLKLQDSHAFERHKLMLNTIQNLFKYTSDPHFLVTVYQPLVLSLLNSPLLIENSSQYYTSIFFNALRPDTSSFRVIFEIIPVDLLCKLFVECSLDVIKARISCVLRLTASLSHKFSKQVKELLEGIIFKVNDYDENLYHVLSLYISLYALPEKMISLTFNGMYQAISSLLQKAIDKHLDGTVRTPRIGNCISLLIQFMFDSLQNTIFVVYLINKKPDILRENYNILYSFLPLFVDYIGYSSTVLSNLALLSSNFLNGSMTLSSGDRVILEGMPVFEGIEYATDDESLDFVDSKTFSIPLGREILISSLSAHFSKNPLFYILLFSSIFLESKDTSKSVPVIIFKDSSQEDYIPGDLSANAVQSSVYGTTMKDIKDKTCAQLGMIDQEITIELLVRNNIISLDLNITDVYKNIWLPHEGKTPMEICLRLQGFNGEATEPVISSFNKKNKKTDMDYSFTNVFVKSNLAGLLALINEKLLRTKIFDCALKSLKFLMKVHENLEIMVEQKYRFLDILLSVLPLIQNGEKAVKQKKIIGKLITNIINHPSFIPNDPVAILSTILNFIETDTFKDNMKDYTYLISVIPSIVSKSEVLAEETISSFISKVKVENHSIFVQPKSDLVLSNLVELVYSLNNQSIKDIFRNYLINGGYYDEAISYILSEIPSEKDRKSPEWNKASENTRIPYALKLIIAVIRGYDPAKKRFFENGNSLFLFFTRLIQIGSTIDIGGLASDVVKILSEEPGEYKENASTIIIAENDKKTKKAAKMRKMLLEKQIRTSIDILSELGGNEDSFTYECCVCKDQAASDNILHIYAYYTMSDDFVDLVTSFICIHKPCHRESVKAVTNNRTEWETAVLANCELQCNCMFPFPSKHSKTNYRRQLDAFLSSICRGHISDHAQFLYNVIVTSLIRLADCPSKIPGDSLNYRVTMIPILINAYLTLGFDYLSKATSPYAPIVNELFSKKDASATKLDLIKKSISLLNNSRSMSRRILFKLYIIVDIFKKNNLMEDVGKIYDSPENIQQKWTVIAVEKISKIRNLTKYSEILAECNIDTEGVDPQEWIKNLG